MTIRLFRQPIRGPFFALAMAEGFVLFLSVYLAARLRFAGINDAAILIAQSIGPLSYKAPTFALVRLLTIASMGLYRAQHFGGMLNIVLRMGASYVLGILALVQLFYFVPGLYLGRGVFLLAASISFVAALIMRFVFQGVVNKNVLKRRVLVYGAAERTSVISGLRRKTGFYLVGFIQASGEAIKVPSHKVIHLDILLVQFA
jgi:FlaA1/EpsC-like NDP-sugar epimerase